jgi:hypothetical protein
MRNQDHSVKGDVAQIDSSGWLRINNTRVSTDLLPWHEDERFTLVRWSPNGRYLAFVVQRPNAQNEAGAWDQVLNDGLWVLDTETNERYFVFRQWYWNQYDNPPVRIIDDIVWSSDNDAILVTVGREKPGHKASIVVGVGGARADPAHYPNGGDQRGLLDVSGGATLPTPQQGFVVTSSVPGQSSRLGIMHYDGGFEQVADGAALGLWMQNAAQLPDGRYAFLGRPSPTGRLEDSAGPFSLYVMVPGGQPTPVPGTSVAAPVLFAEWDATISVLTVHVQVGQGQQAIPLRVNRGG